MKTFVRVWIVALVLVASACGGAPTKPAAVDQPINGGRGAGPAPLVIDQKAQADWDALPEEVHDYIKGKYGGIAMSLLVRNCQEMTCDDTYTVAFGAQEMNRYYGQSTVGGIHDVELDVWRGALGPAYSLKIVSEEVLADTVLRYATSTSPDGGECAWAPDRRNVYLAFGAPGCVDLSGLVPYGAKVHEIGHTLGLPHSPSHWRDAMNSGGSPSTSFRVSDGLQKAVDFLKTHKGKAIKIVG